jgi:tetratricopeptide (TPR) repeat protein
MRKNKGRIQAIIALTATGLFCLIAAAVPCRAASSAELTVVPDAPAVQKFDTPKAQFEHAQNLKKALRGLDGEMRDRARSETVAAYRAVREYFGNEAALCAEAAFRAGELLRTADDLVGALAEFGIARDRGAGTDFRVRAMLEIGHVERRAKHAQPAIAAYEAVVADSTAAARQKDEALLWVGRVYADLERFADARRVWQKVADKGDDPLDRIQAFDQIAWVLIETGDLEGAAGVIKRCNDALSDVSQEETRLGDRVRAALGSMRSVDQLARAIEKRKQSADASDKKDEPAPKTRKKSE